VLALRQIVTDVGADRGILLSEKGFQSGAVEAATLTNVPSLPSPSLAVRQAQISWQCACGSFMIVLSRAENDIGTFQSTSESIVGSGLKLELGDIPETT
jgi:hypothetical protein